MVRETKRGSDTIHHWRMVNKCFVINLAGSKFQMPGIPDCVIIKEGMTIWVEFKDGDKSLEPIQIRRKKEMAAQGIHVFTVNFLEEKEWRIDDQYIVKFKKLTEAYERTLEVLIELHKSISRTMEEKLQKKKETNIFAKLVPVMSLPIIP